MSRLMSLLGLLAMIGVAWLFSNNRKKVNYRIVWVGLAIQFGLGVILLKIKITANAFHWFAGKVAAFLDLSQVGADFVFGSLTDVQKFGVIFAIRVVPTIIFFASFISILYYLGLMQILVEFIARFMQWTMKTSGAETLSCSANIA